MRLLLTFVLACLALLGTAVWVGLRGATSATATADATARKAPRAPAPAVRGEAGNGPAAGPVDNPAPGTSGPSERATGRAPALGPSSAPLTGSDTAAERAAGTSPPSDAPSPSRSSRTTEPVPGPTPAPVRWADEAVAEAKRRLAALHEVLAADPYNAGAIEEALALARRCGWHEAACDLLARLVALRPGEVALRFELATELMRQARWLEALPQLRCVIERQPRNARAWYDLAIAHQALGHLHAARAAWDHVIELLPDNPDARAHRGQVLLDLHEWPAAEADFRTLLGREPDAADAALNLAVALRGQGRLDEARAALLPLLARCPQHVRALNRLAEITWTLYQLDPGADRALAREVVDCCERSLAVDPDQPDIRALRDQARAALAAPQG